MLFAADVTEVELNTDRRAEERVGFEKWKKEREQQAALQKLAAERAQQEHEEQLARQARAEAEAHAKAHPIRKYKNIQIEPSKKPLTAPATPRFSERLKGRSTRV